MNDQTSPERLEPRPMLNGTAEVTTWDGIEIIHSQASVTAVFDYMTGRSGIPPILPLTEKMTEDYRD